MFTGIVEELAQIKSIDKTETGYRFAIKVSLIIDDLQLGDSVSVNGVCLTVVEISKNVIYMDLVEETLNKSNLGELKLDNYVNLERAMKVNDRFGGHIVQGHVETVGVILDKQIQGEGALLSVGISPEWLKFCIPKGSITLDGVSLTIAKINGNIIDIAIIPHTLENTTLGLKNKSDTLNIETDIIGKYIDRLITFDLDEADIDTSFIKDLQNIQYGES